MAVDEVMETLSAVFPPAIEALPTAATLGQTLAERATFDAALPWGLGLFILAILHTFIAPMIAAWGHKVGHGRPLLGRFIELFGEVELVFILWAIPLFAVLSHLKGFGAAVEYLGYTVNYREPLFVMVVMALAATKPIMVLSEHIVGLFAKVLGGGVGAWWLSLLTLGPLLGSLITEPAAITITAMLLARKFFEHKPSTMLSYATIGLLFVNISVGGVLTHFAAPPVVMVAEKWGLTTPFMFAHFGWHAILGIVVNALLVKLIFFKEFAKLGELKHPQEHLPRIPAWITACHILLLAWVVFFGHSTALFMFGLLAGLWFVEFTREHQEPIALMGALKVGIFLAGLVIFGGLQQWWIAPVLGGLSAHPLFWGATILTSFNDNAAITFLASLVPNFTPELKFAVLAGAVTGGGMTVIANAPNPAGQAILKKYFPNGIVNPLGLAAAALIPTLILAWAFMGLPH